MICTRNQNQVKMSATNEWINANSQEYTRYVMRFITRFGAGWSIEINNDNKTEIVFIAKKVA